MRPVFFAVLIIGICVAGCPRGRAGAGTIGITYVDYGFEHTNPYSIDDLASVNRFLSEMVKQRRAETWWQAYVVPMDHYNRLVIIPVDRGYTLSNDFVGNLDKAVREFLDRRLAVNASSK
jgi:hypothetical protein